MSKTSTALRRLGVAGLSAVTIGAGLAAVAAPANAATADITKIAITPTAAAISGTANTCQLYTIQATEPSTATGTSKVDVTLTPTTGITPQFCSGGGTAATGTGKSTYEDTFTLSGTDAVTIGVNQTAATTTNGEIAIAAFPMTTTDAPASGAPTGNATEFVDNLPNQDSVVQKLAATPATEAGSEDSTVPYKVAATDSSSDVVQAATVGYSLTSSQGFGAGSGTCSNTDMLGNSTCDVTVPATTSVQSGPYTVTFTVTSRKNADGTAAADVTTTAKLTTATPAPYQSTVALSCGGDKTTTQTNASTCYEPTSSTTETFTADVTSPPATGTTPVPVQGAIVTFGSPTGPSNAGTAGTETASVSPLQCTTTASGTCSTTLTLSAAATDGDTFSETASISAYTSAADTAITTTTSNAATVDFTNSPPAGDPTNISVSPATATADTGSSDLVTAQVSNTFGDPSAAGRNVFFTVTGGATFSNGTTQETVATGQNGQAQVAVTDAASGTATVTASLASPGDCSTETGGNCSAMTMITFGNGTAAADSVAISPTSSALTAGGSQKFIATVTSGGTPVSGVSVTFNLTGPGNIGGTSSATVPTDANGDASVTVSTGTASSGSGSVVASIDDTTTGCSGMGGSCSATATYTVTKAAKTTTKANVRFSNDGTNKVLVIIAVSPKADAGAPVSIVVKGAGLKKEKNEKVGANGVASHVFTFAKGDSIKAHGVVAAYTNGNGSFTGATTTTKTHTVK